MQVALKKLLTCVFAFLLCAGTPLFAYAGDEAGTVLIVIGEASLSAGNSGADTANANHQAHQIVRGEKIHAGDVITTGVNGHVNLRMIDGAAVIIRASSRLRIEEYAVDTVTPSKSRIKLNLENGVVRSITGRAGEASKESYRLNTPLAAIGIRGTDFVVQADRDVTRVLVQSGAIVMTRLGNDCTRESLGPCKSASSRDLTAAMRDAYLELRGINGTPVFVPAGKTLESPNLIAPPRPDEPRVGADKATKTTTTNSDAILDASRVIAVNTIKTQIDSSTVVKVDPKPETKPETKPEIKPEPKTEVKVETKPEPKPDTPVVVVPVAAKIWWGRWSSFASSSAPLVTSLISSDREVSSSNVYFGLLREANDSVVLPNSGVVNFKLADSESYLMNADKSTTVAKITSPTMSIDFGNRRYDTSLTVSAGNIAPVSIQSQGSITFQGYFISGSNSPNTSIDGSVAHDGNQAGYLFLRTLADGTSVFGATRWTR